MKAGGEEGEEKELTVSPETLKEGLSLANVGHLTGGELALMCSLAPRIRLTYAIASPLRAPDAEPTEAWKALMTLLRREYAEMLSRTVRSVPTHWPLSKLVPVARRRGRAMSSREWPLPPVHNPNHRLPQRRPRRRRRPGWRRRRPPPPRTPSGPRTPPSSPSSRGFTRGRHPSDGTSSPPPGTSHPIRHWYTECHRYIPISKQWWVRRPARSPCPVPSSLLRRPR